MLTIDTKENLMDPTTKLEPLSAPLEGINLIEASAGTGKTYTITTLFIRLILEKHLTVDKILVVTFTEAATEELRDRIRRRLRDALLAFQQGESKDEVLAGLMQHCTNHQDAIFRLTNALRGFDEAAIFTIHSFCRQMLQENAFESGVFFDIELVKNQSHLLREIVEDFWRQHFYDASPLFITYALEKKFDNPARLLSTLNKGQYVGQPFLKIIPQHDTPSVSAEELAFHSAFSKTQQVWQSQAEEIENLLLNDNNLNRNKYRKTSIPQWCQDLDNFLTAPKKSITLPKKFTQFTRTKIATSVTKNKTPPQHDFFDHCENLFQSQQALSDNFQQHLLALKLKLFDIAEQDLARKKHQHHIQSFDDLLINLHKALKGANGQTLAQLIRKKYHAALIDEFQDTDPVQYEIFRTIYGDGNHILFLIGDPKQAIYSFRGADIFTYMAACRDATHRYTLATNWRSEADLIGGVNELFKRVKHPFLFEEIPFQAVQPPKRLVSRLKIENKYLPPLQLWFIHRHQANCLPDKPIKKSWANQQIPISVGNEITRLLRLGQQEQALVGNRPLVAGDIAVLVRKNSQALQMQRVLTKLRIPNVLYSRDSLFTSDEVMEMERVLMAVADPGNEPLIKAALTTDMLGVSGSELHSLMENDALGQKRLNRFQYYHFLWRNVGFIQMFRTLLLKEQVQPRLLSYPDGERRLTNVLHAAELLQQTAVQQKLGISGLCQWLSQLRHRYKPQQGEDGKEAEAEEQQLRLESDEKLVKIVTIHKSKGLEYPIVFCPFVWDGRLHNSKADRFIFHNDKEELTLDLGSTKQEQHRARALEEELAENLRLFYVAVTRAKHRCYLIWGPINEASTSALAHLLHPGIDVAKADDAMLWQSLQSLAKETGNKLQISDLPTDYAPYRRQFDKIEKLKPRRFLGKIDKGWKVSSFSSLSSTVSDDRPDYDETTFVRPVRSAENPLPDKDHIFSFPRGARAGSFMHALFENMDFTKHDAELINIQLANFGYDVEKWQAVIKTLVDDVLNTPLAQPDFSLSRISRHKRLNELEFYYPLSNVTFQDLRALFAEFGHHVSLREESNRLAFAPVRGFMKGYIDMVFEYEGCYYLVDYKSNMLGTLPQAYHHSYLKEVMTREGYILQYHIYAVALHRYLSARLPNYRYEEHFGGVYYLFLRGMSPEGGGRLWDLSGQACGSVD
jgi:exodeoxyribonuclease V beta subunit